MNSPSLEKNLFMMCEKLNSYAISDIPIGFHIRNCQKNELNVWKSMPFDKSKLAKQDYDFMTQFYDSVYAKKEDLFFQKCLFVCDNNNKPIGTCFAWKSYEKITTIHWVGYFTENDQSIHFKLISESS